MNRISEIIKEFEGKNEILGLKITEKGYTILYLDVIKNKTVKEDIMLDLDKYIYEICKVRKYDVFKVVSTVNVRQVICELDKEVYMKYDNKSLEFGKEENE